MFQTGIKSSSGKKRWGTKKEQPKEQKSFLPPRPLPSLIRKYISAGKEKSSCLFVCGRPRCLPSVCTIPLFKPIWLGRGALEAHATYRWGVIGGVAKVMVCSLPGFELTIF